MGKRCENSGRCEWCRKALVHGVDAGLAEVIQMVLLAECRLRFQTDLALLAGLCKYLLIHPKSGSAICVR